MELLADGSQQQDAQECPVCYESLSVSQRTLSCGHVFCHDCLVKTLTSIDTEGNIRDTIACPVCRHLTFIKKQRSPSEDRDPGEGQTLKVLLPRFQSARRVSEDPTQDGGHWVPHCLRAISQRIRRHKVISPSHDTSQIFIISAKGRPMAEEDSFHLVMTVVHPQRRRRRRVCTTSRCLVFLLSVFTILALVAVTLPWILLA